MSGINGAVGRKRRERALLYQACHFMSKVDNGKDWLNYQFLPELIVSMYHTNLVDDREVGI